MSDHVGKHVWDNQHGSLWYRGRVVSETAHTYMTREDGCKSRRVMKTPSLILTPAEVDPFLTTSLWNQTKKEREAEIRAVEKAASDLRALQRREMIAAIKGEVR